MTRRRGLSRRSMPGGPSTSRASRLAATRSRSASTRRRPRFPRGSPAWSSAPFRRTRRSPPPGSSRSRWPARTLSRRTPRSAGWCCDATPTTAAAGPRASARSRSNWTCRRRGPWRRRGRARRLRQRRPAGPDRHPRSALRSRRPRRAGRPPAVLQRFGAVSSLLRVQHPPAAVRALPHAPGGQLSARPPGAAPGRVQPRPPCARSSDRPVHATGAARLPRCGDLPARRPRPQARPPPRRPAAAGRSSSPARRRLASNRARPAAEPRGHRDRPDRQAYPRPEWGRLQDPDGNSGTSGTSTGAWTLRTRRSSTDMVATAVPAEGTGGFHDRRLERQIQAAVGSSTPTRVAGVRSNSTPTSRAPAPPHRSRPPPRRTSSPTASAARCNSRSTGCARRAVRPGLTPTPPAPRRAWSRARGCPTRASG